MAQKVAIVPVSVPKVGKMEEIKVTETKSKKGTEVKETVKVPLATDELVLAVSPAVAADTVVGSNKAAAKTTDKAKTTTTTTKKSNAGKYTAVFFISAIIFFVLFLLLKPNYLMNLDAQGKQTGYNWWKIVLAALISALIVLLIVWAASALVPCK